MRRDPEAVSAAARQRLRELAPRLGAQGYDPEATAPAPVPVPGRHAREQGRRSALLPGLPTLPGLPGLGALRRRHLGLIGLVAVVAVLVAVWVTLRPAPQPMPVASTTGAGPAAGSPVALPTTTPEITPTTTPTPGAGIVVDVAGKVRTPGVFTLPAGSRVVDAVRKAGGALDGVDLSGINLARVLVDGEQILIGVAVAPGAVPSGTVPPAAAGSPPGQSAPGQSAPGQSAPGQAGPPAAKVSLNSASAAALEALPGIGPVTAEKIVAWRTENGGFRAVEDLLEVDGIGPKTLARISPGLTL